MTAATRAIIVAHDPTLIVNPDRDSNDRPRIIEWKPKGARAIPEETMSHAVGAIIADDLIKRIDPTGSCECAARNRDDTCLSSYRGKTVPLAIAVEGTNEISCIVYPEDVA